MEIAEIVEVETETLSEIAAVRRFYLADLAEQGPWLLERLLKAYPNQNDRSLIGWLNGVLDQNEYLCLIMPEAKAVCFAERTALDRLSGQMVVREIFVWVQDPKNASQVKAAVQFYDHMRQWAKHQGIERIIVCESSDVPDSHVRKLGTLHKTETLSMRA